MASSPRTAFAARLLEHGADPEHADYRRMTALMHAASGGHPDTVRLLLQRGGDPRARDAKGRSALGWASPFKPEVFASLLGKTGPVDEQGDKRQDTPLLRAASAGALDTVKLLLARGAQPQPVGSSRQLALTAAVSLRRHSVVDFLLQLEQTQVDFPGDRQRLASLLLAARNGDTVCMATLLHRGTQLDIRDPEGPNALHQAAARGRPQAAAWLMDKGLSAHDRDDVGRTPLLHAARLEWAGMRDADHPSLLALLLQRNADPNATDQAGETALIRLAASGRTDLLRLLVEAGADVNRETPGGESALSRAVRYGAMDDRYRRPKGLKQDKMAEAIHYLLDQGADPLPGGRSLLHDARALRCPQAVGLLKTAEANRQRLR